MGKPKKVRPRRASGKQKEIVFRRRARQAAHVNVDPAEHAALFQRAPNANPFFSPAWITAWEDTLGRSRTAVEVGLRGEALSAYFPFAAVPAMGGTGLIPIGTEAIDRSDPLRDMEACLGPTDLKEALSGLLASHVFLWWPLLGEAAWEACFASWLPDSGWRYSRDQRESNPIVRLGDYAEFEDYVQRGLGRAVRMGWRQAVRAAEARDGFEITVLTDADEVEQLLPIFESIERHSWKGQQKKGILTHPTLGPFYRRLLPQLVRQGEAEIAQLRVEGHTAAYEIGLLAPDWYGMHSVAYRPEFKELSPGKLLLMHQIERSFTQGRVTHDFLQGDYTYKQHYATHTEPLYDLQIFAPNWKGRLQSWLTRRSKSART